MMTSQAAEDNAPGPTFTNPVIRGFNPDPTICVVPATATAPAQYFLSTSTFDFFPGAAIYHSEDLLNWKLIGHALNRRSQLEMRTVEPGAGSWASTLRYRRSERRWYLMTGVFQRYRPSSDERIFPRGFYVWTDDIWRDEAWSEPVYFDNPGFDQDLFWDDDGGDGVDADTENAAGEQTAGSNNKGSGKVYLSTTVRKAERTPGLKLKDFGIHVSEIDVASGRTLTPPKLIRASASGVAEGSHIMRRGGYYYLFTAEGGTESGHQEWVFRSTEGPYGPWEGKGKPLWYNGPDEEVQRTGHCDVFEDGGGRWWAVMLGVRPSRVGGRWIEPQLGRETFLVRVDWEDGWPVFNLGRNVALETVGRDGMASKHRGADADDGSAGGVEWRADLSRSDLELGWYHKNTPLKQCYSLTERPGHLRLYGNCYDLSSPESPAMLLRKQSSYNETFSAEMSFTPDRPGYEAGAVLWWNQYSYASIGVCAVSVPEGSEPVRTVVVREPTGKNGEIKVTYPFLESGSAVPASNKPVRLAIVAGLADYKLALSAGDDVRDNSLNTASVSFQSETLTIYPPVGGAFTGAMFGVYSFGHREPVLEPADFTRIEIVEGSHA